LSTSSEVDATGRGHGEGGEGILLGMDKGVVEQLERMGGMTEEPFRRAGEENDFFAF
jgi:hypothetical protein